MITVVIPVSPIPSHPSTEIIAETWNSVRYHLPDAEIIMQFDGVRPEQEEWRGDYEEAISAMLWRAAHEDGHVLPVIFDHHTHQVGMLRQTLDFIQTPLLLYVEQDTPLITDRYIDWQLITEYVTSNKADVVRLHHENAVPAAHEHLMWDHPDDYFLRTSQWSQRPHVASVDYYRRALRDNFSEDAKAFIEDKMHSVIQCSPDEGTWNENRIYIYDPSNVGTDMQRSYHVDGRNGGPKYDEDQVF